MTDSVVLGINSVYHESSACLVRGGEILAVAEEERFNRQKHAKAAQVDTADIIPTAAIADCLSRAGITPAEIDHVAYSFDPSLRVPFVDEPRTATSWGTEEGERLFLEGLGRLPRLVSESLDSDVSDRWMWVGHELAHAASAFFPSPFHDAAILSIDGIGEHATALLGHGHGQEIDVLSTIAYPHSLGFLWEKLSSYLGLDSYDAPKVMALAAFASPERFKPGMDKLAVIVDDEFLIDLDRLRFRVGDFAPLEELFGPRRMPGEHFDTRHAQVASSLQHVTQEIMFALAHHLKATTGADSFCIAGGVALNCIAMGRLLNDGPFENLFVQPVAHDGGTAIGAALHVALSDGAASRCTLVNPYLGPSFGPDEVQRALDAAPVATVRVDDPSAEAARLIANGEIIGWFQGAAEIGPRALGNRSILGDPRRPGTREAINIHVKHREYFRPFAPAVLAAHVADWFELRRSSISTNFMAFAVDVLPERRSSVPAVLHVDGTSRVQTVSPEVNPRFHALIEQFHRLTGVPLVLNTSFNTYDEPIVSSPENALATFLRTGLDVMVIDDFIVRKP